MHRFYKTGIEYPISCFCAALRGVWQVFLVSQASSTHLLLPLCRTRPSIFPFLVQQLYSMLILCSAMLHSLLQLSEWERALHARAMASFSNFCYNMKRRNISISNDKAKWTGWILSKLTSQIIRTAKAIPLPGLYGPFCLLRCVCIFIHGCFKILEHTEDQLISWLMVSVCLSAILSFSNDLPSNSVHLERENLVSLFIR